MDQPPEPKKSTYPVLWGVLSLVVLALVGGLLVWWIPDQTKQNTKTTPNLNNNSGTSNVSTNSNVNAVPEGWKQYLDKEFGFSFLYPNNWRIGTYPNDTISVDSPGAQEPIPLFKAVSGGIDEAVAWLNANRTEPGSGPFKKTSDSYVLSGVSGHIYKLGDIYQPGGNQFAIINFGEYSVITYVNVLIRESQFEEYFNEYQQILNSFKK